MNPDPYGAPHSFIELSDCSLPYWKIGTGPDLVFVHGWPLDSRTWRASVEQLRAAFTCHLIDLPRAGRSEWTDETRIGVKAYGDILLEAVSRMELGPGKVGFIGQDTGGSYARLAAAEMPGRVSGLVLGNTETPYQHSVFLKALFLLGKLPGLEGVLRTALRMRPGRSCLLLMAGRHRKHLHGEFTRMFLQPLVRDRQKMAGAADILRHIRVREFDDLRAAHEKITAPVRLVWGRSDIWFTRRSAQRMLREFGGPATLEVLRPGRLMIHEEQAQLFAEEVRKHFLAP